MEPIDHKTDPNSIIREFERESISLADLYQRFRKKDIDYKVYVVRENQFPENEEFELVGILGSGRSCYVFLALVDKKLVSLRMSYEESDFTDKFDSVRVEMEGDYDEHFLRLLYPSIPVGYLGVGSVKKKKKLYFDKKVYASFWEKADATLASKLNSNLENKLQWFLEFLKGLRIIHFRQRAHFDIKLENLFLVDNTLKIGDFEYYLKIDDFIQSKIHYCGTPGHIAPEMFYDKKKVTERIDIFSAGAAFAKLFAGVEYTGDPTLTLDGQVTLSPDEEKTFNTLFKKRSLQRLPKKVQEAFKTNFKIFNFYKSHLQKELENPKAAVKLREIYLLLLNMMNIDPDARPDAETMIPEVESIVGKSAVPAKSPDKGIASPVFTFSKTPITIVNFNKKPTIEIGSLKRKEHAENHNINDINLRFVDISRRHLGLTYSENHDNNGVGKIQVCDLDSTHGVFLNKEKLEPGVPRDLSSGDIIQLGSIISFRYTEEKGCSLLKHITQENKKGNLLWMDRNQVKELPDRAASIIFVKKPVYLDLSAFGVGEDITLMVDDLGNIDIIGGLENVPVSGDIIL